VLKDAGLVVDHAVGNRRIYRADPDGLALLRDQLERFWSRALAAYKANLEQPNQEEP
jgi:DNA-binding PadR family transcriptional regulator